MASKSEARPDVVKDIIENNVRWAGATALAGEAERSSGTSLVTLDLSLLSSPETEAQVLPQ